MQNNDPAVVIAILIGFFALFGVIVAAILFFHFRKIKKIRNQNVDFTGEGVSVPLLAAFIGLKAIPFFSFGYNNLNPKLRFCADFLEFKCFRTQTKAYAQVERVEILRAQSLATQNLELHFKNSPFKYTFNVVNSDTLKKALAFLQGKACPLSAAAQAFIKEGKIHK